MKKSIRYKIGLLFLRISISIMLLVHGIQKLDILFSSNLQFSDPIGLGPTITLILVLIAEIICPILIIFGYRTRFAAIPPIILMLVAVLVVKAGASFEVREIPLLYLVSFITIAMLGPGALSVDKH